MLPPPAVGSSTATVVKARAPSTVCSHCTSSRSGTCSRTPEDSCTPVLRSALLDGGPRQSCVVWLPDLRESRAGAGTSPGRRPLVATTRAQPPVTPPAADAPTKRGGGSAPGTASSGSAPGCSRCRSGRSAASVRSVGCQAWLSIRSGAGGGSGPAAQEVHGEHKALCVEHPVSARNRYRTRVWTGHERSHDPTPH